MSAHNARISAASESTQWDLILTRVFDAPRELVFKAWTDTQHMQQWWGPNGFTNPVCELDTRAGGAIRIDMRAPDGVVYPMKGVFEEIIAPERLVFISSALDGKGNSMFDILNTVTFAAQRGKTALTLQARVIKATAQAPQYLKGMEAGWTQSLDRLNTLLVSMEGNRKGMHLATSNPSDREIVATRIFDAPREIVWKMWTDPAHLAQWWGPRGFRTTVQLMNVQAGGEWRLIMHGPDGRDYHNRIIYREVAKPERLVYQHSPEKGSEPVSFQTTVTFAEQGTKTKVGVTMLFPSAAARDYVVKTYGAVEGLSQTLARLDEKLATMSSPESAEDDEDDLVVSRIFNAPRDLVFKAWTEPDHLEAWWGPKGWTIAVKKMDLRPGGIFHYVMHRPQGQMWGKFVYREIVGPERIVFVNCFANEKGESVRGPFDPNLPVEILHTVLFTEAHGKTTLTLRGHPINATEVERKTYAGFRDSMKQGFGGTFDRLDEYLANS
jgi:uncharacterized protein YndB with AHSA1/START domain